MASVDDAAALRSILATHPPSGHLEVAAEARFRAELDRLAHPCDRHADPVHVTASGVVAGRRGTVLLLHRRLGRWLQPGGHIEPGEAPPAAALREALEETGLDLAHPGEPHLLQVDVHEAAAGHVHLDLRYLLVAAGSGEPDPGPGESTDVRWYDWEEAIAIADRPLAEGLRRGRSAWAMLSHDGGEDDEESGGQSMTEGSGR